MKNALYFFLSHPHGLIVIGTVLAILGLVGLSLFSRSDIVSTELDDGPKSPDKGTMTVLIYGDRSKEVGDRHHLKVFANADGIDLVRGERS